jgi:hypothetical protein
MPISAVPDCAAVIPAADPPLYVDLGAGMKDHVLFS